MKYYAVTDDPRELYHYGVKGMKWGQHIFGDKPKSPGYHRALGKLRSSAQKDYSKRAAQQKKYNDAVKKTQDRINQIENLYKLDQEKRSYDQVNREYKQAHKMYKAENRRLNKYARNEAKMDRIMEQARQGKLKYGQLSEDQIQRVQDRLNLENQTRRLGAQEKSWHNQKKEARRQGKLLGIQKGTAAIMEEVARAGAQFGIQGLKNRMLMKSQAKHEGQYERVKQRVKNKKSNADMREEVRNKIKQEVYENEVREGSGVLDRAAAIFGPTSTKAQLLKVQNNIKEQKHIEDERKKLNDDLYRKLVLGDKKNDPIRSREEREKLYEEIFGKTSTTKLDTPKEPPKSKNLGSQLFENFNDPILTYAGVRQRVNPTDIYNGKELSKQDKKAIVRNNKKWAKAQRDAVARMNRH